MNTTLVIQSYRTRDVPEWLTRCMKSVVDWSKACGLDYEFVDDSLFDLLPAWYRERCGSQILPQTDLARLLLLRDRLRRGYRRVLWIDADVFICDPSRFAIEMQDGFAFCYEVWVESDANGSFWARGPSVNNAVTVMDAGNPLLDFYIYACQSIIRQRPAGGVGRLDASTLPLSRLGALMPLPLIRCVGLISPPVTRQVARGGGPLCAYYAAAFGRQMGAVNLCSSLRGIPTSGVTLADQDYAAAIEVLERTRGGVFNQYLE